MEDKSFQVELKLTFESIFLKKKNKNKQCRK